MHGRFNNIFQFWLHTGRKRYFVDERMCLFEILKYAIKSGTVARLTSGHDVKLCFTFRARRHAACHTARAITHGATWLTRDPSFVRRPPRKRKTRGSDVSVVVREHRKTRQLRQRVTHASTSPAYVIKALDRVSSRFLLCAPRTPCSRRNRWREVGNQWWVRRRVSRGLLLCKAWLEDPESTFLET